MMTLYRHQLSGHSHRVQPFLSLLGLEHRLVDVDLRAGAHKQSEFLARNPFGQVPVLVDGRVTLADSNAILVYLALRYGELSWFPREPEAAARVQRWLSVAAGELARGPATARLVTVFGAAHDQEAAKALAGRLFGVLEEELATRPFLIGGKPTLADIALYSYTARAPQGGVALTPYPAIRAWLGRIEVLPRFVPMVRADVPEAA